MMKRSAPSDEDFLQTSPPLPENVTFDAHAEHPRRRSPPCRAGTYDSSLRKQTHVRSCIG